MAYSLILFGPVVWSCGPAQVYGLVRAPYDAYKYFTAKDEEEEKDVCETMSWNATAMIPLIGTWIAINADDKKRREKAAQDDARKRREHEETKEFAQ